VNIDKQLSMAVFDTCSTMHGNSSGVATRLRGIYKRLITAKCVSHTGALAIKHAVDSIPFLAKQWYPTLTQGGNLMDYSPKKQVLLTEVNAREGTKTKAISRVAATRWHSLSKIINVLQKSEDMATIIKTFIRAGEGGDDEMDEYLDAGRADASALGVACLFSTREFLALICAAADVVPELNRASKMLQAHDLDAESCRAIQDNVISMLKDVAEKPGCAKRSETWREYVEEVESRGIDVRQTRRRDDDWIDEQIKKFHIANWHEHKQMWPDREITTALTFLFDVHQASLPMLPCSNEVLSAHFGEAMNTVANFYSVPADEINEDKFALSREHLMAEWDSFVRLYLEAANRNKAMLLKVTNKKEKQRIAILNEIERLDGVPEDQCTKFEEKKKVSLKTLIAWSYEHQMEKFPCIRFLAATWLVTMESQAPVESAFSRLKRVVTPLRSCMKQDVVETLMTLILNGPHSLAGKQAGFTTEMLVTRAKEIWAAQKKRRIDITRGVEVPPETLNYKFGEGFDHCSEVYDAVMKAAEEEELANSAKRTRVVTDADADLTAVPTEMDQEPSTPQPTGASDKQPSHCWLLALGRGGRQERRAYLAEPLGATPQIADKVAVTGFGGSVWYSGEIVAVGVGEKGRNRGKPVYTIFFPADMTYVSDTALPESCYGRGIWDPVKKKCTLGWVFLLPIKEAGGPIELESTMRTKDLSKNSNVAEVLVANSS
jgi:hypothetical protein